MINFSQLATETTINTTKKSLEANGINVLIAENGEKAKELALSLIPEGVEVMTATSTTLDQLGLTTQFNDTGKYNSVKSQLAKLNRETDSLKMQKLGAAPEYVIGSIHAVTEDGKIIVASGSGSQLPAYSYGASHVVWLVSTKKIVEHTDSGMKRIYEHILPQEDARMKKVYGPNAGSSPRKLLIINQELNPNRIHLVFIKQDLGF